MRCVRVVGGLVAGFLSACTVHLVQDPPKIPPSFADSSENDINGGRVAAIAVSPLDPKRIIFATEFGGLWSTVNGGQNWHRVFSLPTEMVADVQFGADGTTVIATVMRDNQVSNGGGIYVSHDRGATWVRPPTGIVPPATSRTSAYGIAEAPDQGRTWYVATDYGIAISTDNGDSWTHHLVGATYPRMAHTALAFSRGRVLAMMGDGVYRSDDGGATWRNAIPGFFGQWSPYNVNAMDRAPDADWAFILREYHNTDQDKSGTLWFYELDTDTKTQLTTKQGNSRGPFVHVTREEGPEFGPWPITVWTGHGWDGYRVTRTTAAEFRALGPDDWTSYIATAGIHADMGDMGVSAFARPVLLGSDGGIFKPRPPGTNVRGDWMSAAVPGSGLNSFQITDLAGTNIRRPDGALLSTSLYFGTQDNSVWASPDGGQTWPRADGGEGFAFEVRPDAGPGDPVTVGYVDIGGDWSEQFSDANLVNQRLVPNLDQNGQSLEIYSDSQGRPLNTMKQAFYLEPTNGNTQSSWIRLREGGAPTNEIFVSTNSGNNWRRRFELHLPWKGSIQRTNIQGGPVISESAGRYPDGRPVPPFRNGIMAWIAVSSAGRMGLVPLSNLYLDRVDTIDDSDVRQLPDNGSLAMRAAQWDYHAVFGVDPFDWQFLIAPDVRNGVVKISHDGGISWTTDNRLTAQVRQGGRLLMYDRDDYHMQVTHIAFDPYLRSRILVGTRDSGVICSNDRGKTWYTITNSPRIGYVTGFHFYPDGAVHIASWGHGLWRLNRTSGCSKTDRPYWLPRFPPEGTVETGGVLERAASTPPPELTGKPMTAKLLLSSPYPASGMPMVGPDNRLEVAGRDLPPGATLMLVVRGAKLDPLKVVVGKDGTFIATLRLDPALPVGQYALELLAMSPEQVLASAEFAKTVAAFEGEEDKRRERD